MRQITKSLSRNMSTVTSEVLQSKIHKFEMGDFPKALNYSRPFGTKINM